MPPFPKSRSRDLVVYEVEAELMVYDLLSQKAFCLNKTSGLVFQACNGKNSVGKITQLVSQSLSQPVCEEMVWLALDSLKKEKLLEDADEFAIEFKGLNRRQIIKKVGLASMVALPMISSVVAPDAAYAQSISNCPPLGTCIPAGSVICKAGCTLRVNCELRQAATSCTGPLYAPQPSANVNCATFPNFSFPPADCRINLSPA